MLVKSTPFTNNATLILLQLAYHGHNQSTQGPGSSVGYVLACEASGPGSNPARVEYFPVVNSRCYLWLFMLYINIKISKNSC